MSTGNISYFHLLSFYAQSKHTRIEFEYLLIGNLHIVASWEGAAIKSLFFFVLDDNFVSIGVPAEREHPNSI